MYEEAPINYNSLPPICKFLKKNGWCQYGENCRFRHDLTPLPTPNDGRTYQRGGSRHHIHGRGGAPREIREENPRKERGDENSDQRAINQTRHDQRGGLQLSHDDETEAHHGQNVHEAHPREYSKQDHRQLTQSYNAKNSAPGNGTLWHNRDTSGEASSDYTRRPQRGRYEPRRRGFNGDYFHRKDNAYYFHQQPDFSTERESNSHERGENPRSASGSERGRARGSRRGHGRGRSNWAPQSESSIETAGNESKDEEMKTFTPENTIPPAPVTIPINENAISSPTDCETDQRDTEIRQLLRRFPKAISHENGLEFELDFYSSDPDWPYDVKTIGLNIHLPLDYPRVSMKVTMPEMSSANLPIPEVLRQYTEEEIHKWVSIRFEAMKENGVTELAVRPFCRWLDRNMETIFTEGLIRTKREIANQASGFVFIRNDQNDRIDAANSNQPENDNEDDDGVAEEEDDDDDEYEDGTDGEEEEEEEEEQEWTDEEEIDKVMEDLSIAEETAEGTTESTRAGETQSTSHSAKEGDPTLSAPVRKGTEMKLVNMELGENISLLRLVGLALVAQCSKCKKKVDVSLGPGRTQSKTCEKCRTIMTIQFRPALAHVHSPVLGFLDIFGATPFDLVTTNSKFSLECLNCNRGQAPSGLHAGKSGNGSFCSQCHARLHVAFSSVKFTTLVANEAFVPKPTVSAKQEKKKAISMGIREGHPLPQSGACQHYKKSFRWFRFSCCGRIFPCDRCHEEEVKDHEPDFAPKMICGHCSKEQPFQKDKPCVSCGESTTRPRTSHWEGGKGCRNKLKMAATDKQKYRNCNKTLSRKTKEKLDAAKPGNDKKETKLRHT